MPGRIELQPGRHLRLLVESDGTQTQLLEATVVDEGLPQPVAVMGPVIYAMRAGGTVAWTDTMPDPFERRGLPRRGGREHHFSRGETTTFVLRVPLPLGDLPADFDIEVLRAGEAVPERPEEIRGMLTAAPQAGLRIAYVDLTMLREMPGWEAVERKARRDPGVSA